MESGMGILTEIWPTDVSDGIETKVIVLPEGDYGSLRTKEWSRLVDRLCERLKDAQFSLVIVDLDRGRSYGASFLGAIVNLASCLNKSGVQLQVRGDRFGLLKQVGLEEKFCGAAGMDPSRSHSGY